MNESDKIMIDCHSRIVTAIAYLDNSFSQTPIHNRQDAIDLLEECRLILEGKIIPKPIIQIPCEIIPNNVLPIRGRPPSDPKNPLDIA